MAVKQYKAARDFRISFDCEEIGCDDCFIIELCDKVTNVDIKQKKHWVY